MNLDYLCGFIDGEGCISLTTTPLLQVAQTNEEVLIQAQELTGIGAVYKLKDRQRRSPIWEWQANGVAVIELLEKIVDKEFHIHSHTLEQILTSNPDEIFFVCNHCK